MRWLYILLIFIGINLLINISHAAITYDADNNRIIVVGDADCGNSSSNPCTFEDIYQADVANGWDVVSKQDDNQYAITCALQIGDGTNETWLIDTNKEISFTGEITLIEIKNKGHFRLGEIIDETNRTTSGGCYLYMTSSYGYNFIRLYDTAELELFSSTINGNPSVNIEMRSGSNFIRLWNSLLIHTETSANGGIAQADLYRVTIQQTEGVLFNFLYGNDIAITDSSVGLQLSNVVSPITINNVRMINEETSFDCSWVDADVYVINTECKWIFEWVSSGGKIYRQYTFNLKVVDSEGNPIPGASIKIWDKNGNLVVDEITDSNGTIPEQILTYGYYDQDHGSTPVMFTPHTIRIHHRDYPPREFQFILDKPIDWTISLKDRPKSSGIIQVYGTEYYPGEEGIIYAQVLYGDGTPANNAVCNVTIWNKDNVLLSNQQMKYITDSNGIYYYNFTVPSDISVFLADVVCENPSVYGSAEFHVTNIAEIASLVWSYANRTLTDYNESSIAQSVWNYTDRTLTNYNETSIAYAVWNYTNRTLTRWNFTQGYIADYDVAELVYPGKEWKATLTVTTIDGTPVDVDNIVVKIYDPSQTLVLTKDMTHISTGAYKVEWSVPASPALGLYQTFAEVYKDGVLITKKYKVFRVAQTGPADIRVTALQKYIKKGEHLPIKIEVKNAGGIGTDFQITYWIEKDSGKYEETTETLYIAGGETKTIYRQVLVPMTISIGSAWIKAKAYYDPSQPEAYSQDTFYITEGIAEERGGGITFAPYQPTKYPLIIIISSTRPVHIYIYDGEGFFIKDIPDATGIVQVVLDEGKYKIRFVCDGKEKEVYVDLDRPKYVSISFQVSFSGMIIYFVFVFAGIVTTIIMAVLIVRRFRGKDVYFGSSIGELKMPSLRCSNK